MRRGHRSRAAARRIHAGDAAITILALAWAAVALLAAGPAAAGQVADNAYARSLGLRPEFLDDVALLFLYPQRAGDTPTGVFSFVRDSSVDGLGAVGNWRRNGFFFLAQPAGGTQTSSLLQAGWGASWRPLRIGLSFRGNHQETENSTRYTSPGLPSQGQATSLDLTHLEGACGLGVEGGSFALDAGVEVTREDVTVQFARTAYDTLAAALENTEEP